MKDIRYIVYSGLMLLLIGCANRGIGPQGGPRDSVPPTVMKEDPMNRTTNFKAKKIEITFDEYIQSDNAAENILMSPPMKQMPDFRFVGKKVLIQLNDTLKPETTYTIDFGRAICDFTEKNPLAGYRYAFSTGEVIDSMSVEGTVLNSEDLKPAIGVLVGAYADKADSVFEQRAFDYVSKTDSSGYFHIDNMRPGTYSIYALQDISRDYFYQPGEGLAFGMVQESVFPIVDSLELDSVEVDSVEVKEKDLPTLYFFKEEKVRQYLQRGLRQEAYQMQFLFAGKQDSVPTFRVLRPSEVDTAYSDSKFADWMPYSRWLYNKTSDTISVWLTDSIAIGQDSIFVEVSHYRTDSVYQLEHVLDTVKMIYRAPRLTEKLIADRKQQWDNRKLKISSSLSGTAGVDKPLVLTFAMSADSIMKDSITLWHKVDTVYHPLNFELKPLDDIGLRYEVDYPWRPGEAYEMRIDSGLVRDCYGKVNDKTLIQFKKRSLEDYATLRVYVVPAKEQLRVQLLDKQEKMLRDEPLRGGQVYFEHLDPSTYRLRVYEDKNGDGRWTTGDWMLKRQPEPVYNHEKDLNMKANWDFEETINHNIQ